ncbi:MAG: lamin tail domain-containing protein [bacterium]|nr:lamin tail domain-containing protein [bacterium]
MPSHCRNSSRLWRWLPVALLLVLPVVADQASAAPAAVADHVVISEIMALANTATNRPLCSEYVEIHNPTASAVDLGQYYLTDAMFTTNNQAYWHIAEADPSATTAGGGTFSDFHAKFPVGYSIAAGDTVVISIEGSNKYQAAYGRLPDFELYEDNAAPDGVPELVEVFPGSVSAGVLAGGSNTPTLTDTSESLVLYRWDGSSDLVQDVDYARWGTSTSVIVNKTGVTVGASTYLPDSASQQTITATSSFGTAYMRASADEGTEATTGGNGLTGHNETSENFTATFAALAQDPALAPGVPHAAAPIITAHAQAPATPVDGEAVTVSVTALSPTAVTAVTFHYTVDGGAPVTLNGNAAGADTWSAVIPAQALGAVVRWYADVVNSAGAMATYPTAAPRFTTSWTVITPPPPTITGFAVSPAAPYGDLPATISVTATSISALTGAVFHYSVDGGAFAQLAGTAQGGGVYSATVPGQDADAVVTWYAVVTNAAALSAASPADAPASTHTWTVGAAPDPKLLLTEVCTIGSDQEFVEIWNPSTQNVDLSDYYLSDAIYFPNNTGYWNLGGAVLNADTVGGGAFTDFTARFPEGFTIAAGDTIVVSMAGSTKFTNSFAFAPDIELYEDDAFPDAVPDMRSVFPAGNSIINSDSVPSLTNTGEPVILFKWTEGTALVVDVDVFVYGAGGSYQFSKTGKSVAGSTYAPETAVGSQQLYVAAAAFGDSYTRIDASEGSQVLTGSNGVGGRDELSEPWSTTWTLQPASPARPGSGGGGGEIGMIALVVPAQTFLPSQGETFPVKITSRPRSETRVRLFDREGRLVRTLFDSRANGTPSTVAGAYTTIAWNGLDETLQRVPSGLYMVHLSVVDKVTGVEETRTAPVVVTTRLSR